MIQEIWLRRGVATAKRSRYNHENTPALTGILLTPARTIKDFLSVTTRCFHSQV
jgi:hypothetical protein